MNSNDAVGCAQVVQVLKNQMSCGLKRYRQTEMKGGADTGGGSCEELPQAEIPLMRGLSHFNHSKTPSN